MNDALASIPLPLASATYDATQIDYIVLQLVRQVDDMIVRGRVRANNINVTGLPSGAGAAPAALSTGDVWHDTVTNILRVIP